MRIYQFFSILRYGKGTIQIENKGELIDCATTDFLGFAHNNETIQVVFLPNWFYNINF